MKQPGRGIMRILSRGSAKRIRHRRPGSAFLRFWSFSRCSWRGLAEMRARSRIDDEYRVKAAFLFHFAQLIDWPADKFTVADNSFYLCTFGEDPFQGGLESTLAGRTIGNRAIRIRHLKQPPDLQGCHLLFIGKAQSKVIPVLLADLRNAPVL